MTLNDQELTKIEKRFKKLELEEKLNKIRENILMIPISDFNIGKLLPFQIQHVQNLIFAIQQIGLCCDMSDTGAGKTYCAVSICKQLNLRPLIIGPKSVVPTWYKTCRDFEVDPLGVVNYETLKNGKYYSDYSDFQIEVREECPYIEIIRVNVLNSLTNLPVLTATGRPMKKIQNIIWKIPNNTLIIFDEAHKGKNGVCASKTSVNSQVIVSIKSALDKTKVIYGLFLSASITDKPENLDVLLYLFGFYESYSRKSYKMYLKTLGDEREVILGKIHKMLFPLRGSRIRIDQLPPGIFKKNDVQAKTYPVSKEIARAIEEQHQAIQRALNELRNKGESQGLGYIIRCWQKIEVLKSDIVACEAINYLREDKSVVIFVNFNETKSLITEKILSARADESLNDLSSTPLINIELLDYIHGDQTGAERETIVQKFQNDELFALICNIKAGGVGISLHDLHGIRQRVSLICPTWGAIDLKQALGRIYRTGAQSDAIQRIVYCKEVKNEETENYLTIEEQICTNVNVKLENIELLNDDTLVGVLKI